MTKEGMERENDFKDNHKTLKRYYDASDRSVVCI